MKLLNREPTKEMLAIGYSAWGVGSVESVWQAMFDAAPELTVDMEPVAWESHTPIGGELFYDKQEAMDASDGFISPVYSATKLATLQAENERLKSTLVSAEQDQSAAWAKCEERKAERDELLKTLQIVKHGMSSYGPLIKEIREVVTAAIAKHEGEKHV